MNKTILAKKLYTKHESASRRMGARVAKLLPVGTRVSWITCRLSHKHRQYGRVFAHRPWWSAPFTVTVINDATEKLSDQCIGMGGFRVLK